MQREPVESTTVASIGYDETSQTLEVEFNDSRIYEYYNVGQNIYEAFMETDSKGRFLNSQIKGSFPYERVG